MHGRCKKYINYFGQKTRRQEPLARPKHRWEDNIRMDITETGCEGMKWMHLTQDSDKWKALMNMVMNFKVP
jgi:hypothetical protein